MTQHVDVEPDESLGELRTQLAEATASAVDAYGNSTRLIRLLTVIGQPSAPEQLVDEVLRVLSDVFAADVACMTRPTGRSLVVSQACGLPEAASAFDSGWALGPAASEAILTRRSVARAGLVPSDDLPPEMAALGVGSAAWIPLSTGRSSSGLLVLFRSSGAAFTAADLKMLDSVAYRLCVSIEAGERRLTIERLARMGHHLTRHLESEALLADAAEQFRMLTKADSVVVTTVLGERAEVGGSSGIDADAMSDWPTVVAELPGWPSLQLGLPFVEDCLATDGRGDRPWDHTGATAYLAVPIMQDGRPVAVLSAFDDSPAVFGPDMVEVATIFASYVGAAMANVLLYRALAHSGERLRLITDSISDMIAVVDRHGAVRYASPSYSREVGLDPEELIGRRAVDLAHPDDRAGLERALGEGARTPKVEYRLLTEGGVWIWVESALRPGRSSAGEIVLSSRVITDRKELENELRQRATHDAMTGLANRDLVRQRLDAALASEAIGAVGLLYCDLDNFKAVNDRLGHEAGDILLRKVADRLRSCTRPGDLLARIGGDEFVVVLDAIGSLRDVTWLGERVLSALERPFDLLGEQILVSASVGGVLGVRGKVTAVNLLRDADAAMYEAKAKGRGRLAVFDEQAVRASLERLSQRNEIDHALDDHPRAIVVQV